jgi:hypothetical protein
MKVFACPVISTLSPKSLHCIISLKTQVLKQHMCRCQDGYGLHPVLEIKRNEYCNYQQINDRTFELQEQHQPDALLLLCMVNIGAEFFAALFYCGVAVSCLYWLFCRIVVGS